MICSKCGLDKPESDFYKSNKYTCIECVKKINYENRVKRLTKYAEENGITYTPRGHLIKSNDPTLKYCSSCNQFLSLDKFGYHRGKNGNLYINSSCKKCSSIRAQRSPNRDSVMLKSNINKKIRASQDPEYKEHLRAIKSAWNHSKKGIAYSMWKNAKTRATLLKIPFDITSEDIFNIIPEECPILKHKLEIGNLGGDKYSPSLDRIVPELGYVKGNIQIISRLANAMKNNATPEELKLFAEYIINNY